jgi:hypothetical protein
MTKHVSDAEGQPPAVSASFVTGAARRRLLVLVFAAAALLSIGTAAWAYWSTTGTGTASSTTATLNAPTNAAATATAGSRTVSVTWTGSTLSTSQPAQGYYLTRINNSDSTSSGACATSPAALLTATSCSDLTVPDGTYHYLVTAVYHSWTAIGGSSNSVAVSAASKLAFTGQPSNTVAGASISPAVAVTVEDAAGNPVLVPGTSVTVAIGTNPAGGTLSGTVTSTTNASGVATFGTVSINKAGAGYTLSAVSGTLTGATSSTFNITAAAASKLAFGQQPTTTIAGASISPAVTVQILDQFGNLTSSTANVTLAIGTNPSGGTLSGTLTQAAASGVATFGDLSINRSGTGYTLTAGSSGLTGAASSSFNISAAAAAKFVMTSAPASGQASTTATVGPITVQEQDSFGNPVTAPTGGTTVTLASDSTGTKVFAATSGGTPTTSVTIPAGSSSVNFFYGDTKAGSPTVTASGSLTSANQTETITAAAANKLAFGQQPTNTAAGVSISPAVTVQILDQFGNLTSSTANVTLAIGTNPSGGTLSGTLTQAAASGVATFGDLSINKAGTGYTFTAGSSGLTGATSGSFNITASKLVFTTSPSNSTGGTPFATQPVVTVQDAGGNTVTTDTSAVSLAITTPAGATLSCTANPKAATAGVASFAGCAIDRTGSYTLTATDGSLTAAVSSSFTVTTGPASKLAFTTSPSNSTGGAPFATQPVVTVQDAGGNTVTTDTSAVSLTITTPAGATLSCTANPKAATAGVASFAGCAIDRTGSYTLSATDGSLTSTVSNSFTITVGPASRIAWINNSATNCALPTGSVFALDYTSCGSSGTTFISKLMLTDAGGNQVTNTGSAITVTVTKSAGTFTGSASVTIPTGGSVSNSGGDGTVAGEITFSSTSTGNYTNTITATPGAGGYTAATATFHKQ